MFDSRAVSILSIAASHALFISGRMKDTQSLCPIAKLRPLRGSRLLTSGSHWQLRHTNVSQPHVYPANLTAELSSRLISRLFSSTRLILRINQDQEWIQPTIATNEPCSTAQLRNKSYSQPARIIVNHIPNHISHIRNYRHCSTTKKSLHSLNEAIINRSPKIASILHDISLTRNNTPHVIGIPIHCLVVIFDLISKNVVGASDIDLIMSILESGNICVNDTLPKIGLIRRKSKPPPIPPELYHLYLKFKYNFDDYRDPLPGDSVSKASTVYGIIDEKVGAALWENPSMLTHISLLRHAISSNNPDEVSSCYHFMEKFQIFSETITRMEHITACLDEHRAILDVDGAWRAVETIINYANTQIIFERIIPLFLNTKNLMLFEMSEDSDTVLAHQILHPKSVPADFEYHKSHDINRVSTLLKVMYNRGLDPRKSDRISKSMIRFCGCLGLEKCMFAWIGDSDLRDKVVQTNVLSSYIVQWRIRKKLVVIKGVDAALITKEITRLEGIIDSRVNTCLTGQVDRALLGMIMNHYVARSMIAVSESIVAALWGFDKAVMDFVTSKKSILTSQKGPSSSISVKYPSQNTIKIPKSFVICGSMWSSGMYAPLFVSYFRLRDFPRAERVLRFIASQNMSIDKFFVRKVITDCFTPAGDWESAVALVDQYTPESSVRLVKGKVHPSVSICLLATLHQSRRDNHWNRSKKRERVPPDPGEMEERIEGGVNPMSTLKDLEPIFEKYDINPFGSDTGIMIQVLRLCQHDSVFVEMVYDSWVVGAKGEGSMQTSSRPDHRAYMTLLSIYLHQYRLSRLSRSRVYPLNDFEEYLIGRARCICRKMKEGSMWRQRTMDWIAARNGLNVKDIS